MKLKEILHLKKDIVFGGAVQTDWFYDLNKVDSIASNFVFHGPDYFGVTQDDIEFKSHKLMDTCSFTNLISKKLKAEDGNPIILTIAGYGTGKSHLAVTLGALFSKDLYKNSYNRILGNLAQVDRTIGNEIRNDIDKPNLVLVLNGMKDFNLNFEILNCAKKSLKLWGYDDSFFGEFTKAYNTAYKFLDKNYITFETLFKKSAEHHNLMNNDLKDYLLNNIYDDNAFDCINEVYNEVVGSYISWDEGISGAEVLSKLREKLCGDRGKFNKILILFDEFGRYIEYASEYPNRAGDSALQQIFEVVQDSNNEIIFNAFIQSDLKTYLARVNKSSNISRYIGRYDAGEKIYLSSNLETIFANLIQKDKELFNHYVKTYFNRESVRENNQKLFNYLNQWLPSASTKGVWSNYDSYENVILEGIYPLNPIATWLITSLSDWYQQRSALNFLIKSFGDIENKDINELGDLPEIRAIDIIIGDLFEELLLAETEGRQKSEYCIVYDKILTKYKDKLTITELDILAGILVLKLCKFKTKTKDELYFALSVITGLSIQILENNLRNLDETYGIVSYDDKNCTYDFVEDATGKIDFIRMLRKKKNIYKVDIDYLFTEDVIEKVGLPEFLLTSFGKANFIKTNEWKYEVSMLPISSYTELDIQSYIKDYKTYTIPERIKGKLIYLYNNVDQGTEYIDKLCRLYNKYNLNNYPIIFSIIDDVDNSLYELLVDNSISKHFTDDEKVKYNKYINSFEIDNTEKLGDYFKEILSKKLYIEADGIVKKNERIAIICNTKFEQIYNRTIPFDFDGFDKKTINTAKKIHASICKLLIQNSLNNQTLGTLSVEVINRIKSVMTGSVSGWGTLVLSNNNVSTLSPANLKVKYIYDKLDDLFYTSGKIKFNDIVSELTDAPYGLNDYSVSLLISNYILSKYYESKIMFDKAIISNTNFAQQVFTEKGFSISKFNKASLIKIDVDGYKQAYQKICQQIESNNDLDAVINLNSELQALINENDPPEEYKEKVAGCLLILEEGTKLYNKINNSISRLEGRLDKAIEENDFKDILSIILETNDISSVLEESSRFVFNNNYMNRIIAINNQGRRLIENDYLKFLPTASCKGIGQATRYENWMKIMIDSLNKLGYIDLARKTYSKLEKELGNLELLKARQNFTENVDNYLKKKVNSFTTQEELLNIQKEGKALLTVMDKSFGVDDISKKKLKISIDRQIKECDNLLNAIVDSITDIYDLADEVQSLDDLKNIKSKIDTILNKKLRKEDKQDIEDIGNVVQNFLTDINDIALDNNLLIRKELLSNIEIKYQDNEYINLDNVINTLIGNIDKEIELKNEQWCNNNLNCTADIIKGWNSNRCFGWLKDTNALPTYLNNENKTKYEDLKILVSRRIIDLKIESVLEIFENMSDMERNLCISKLKEKFF